MLVVDLARSRSEASTHVQQTRSEIMDRVAEMIKEEQVARGEAVGRVQAVLSAALQTGLSKERTAREDSAAKANTQMEQHVERLRQSLADGIAGIPYALSKVDEAMNKADMQVTEERAAREEAFAKLQRESKQEWTDQRHRLDDMNSRLTEMLATHQQMESSAAAKLEKDMEAVVTRFEGLNQDVESKLAAKLESAMDEKIAATGRKFQVAMGKWCKEAISKGEQGLSKERAAREQGESKLLAKLDQDCQG